MCEPNNPEWLRLRPPQAGADGRCCRLCDVSGGGVGYQRAGLDQAASPAHNVLCCVRCPTAEFGWEGKPAGGDASACTCAHAIGIAAAAPRAACVWCQASRAGPAWVCSRSASEARLKPCPKVPSLSGTGTVSATRGMAVWGWWAYYALLWLQLVLWESCRPHGGRGMQGLPAAGLAHGN